MTFAWLVPRIVLAAILIVAAIFAFFESIYLRDQASMFAEPRIGEWMWVFRGASVLLVVLSIALFVRK